MFPEDIKKNEEDEMFPDEERLPPLDSYGQIYIMMMKMIERGAFGFKRRTSLSGLLDSLFGSGRGRDQTEVVKRILGVCPICTIDDVRVIMVGRWLNKHKGITEVWLRFGDEKGWSSGGEFVDVAITRQHWLEFLKTMGISNYYTVHATQKMKKVIEKGYFRTPEEDEDMILADEIRKKALAELKKVE